MGLAMSCSGADAVRKMARSLLMLRAVRAGPIMKALAGPYYSTPAVAAAIASMSAPRSLPSVPAFLYGLEFSRR